MRIPDYRFTASIKDENYWSPKKCRVDKIREEEFGEELKEVLYKTNLKKKRKKIYHL